MNVATNSDTLNQLKPGFNGSSIVLGTIMILLGILMIAHTLFAAVFTELWVGWIFIFSGIIHCIYTFKTKDSDRFLLKFLLGFLYLTSGLILIIYPFEEIITLILVVGSCILTQSLTQIVLSLQLRHSEEWVWVIFSGILGVIFGSLIIFQFCNNATWLVDLLVGIKLITDGISIGIFSATATDAIEDVSQQQSQVIS